MQQLYREHTWQSLQFEPFPFARGQEGEVYRTALGTLLKLYFEPTEELHCKIETMRTNPPPRKIRRGLAWPRAVIVDEQGCFRGYESTYFADHFSVATVLDPIARQQQFPRWTFQHSVCLARNLAELMVRIHRHDVIVGDMNPENFLFDDNLLTAVVDLDSAQVRGPRGHLFPSRRSTPATTPPEVLATFEAESPCERTIHHDAFGLAVIAYELLLDWHPYAGTYVPTNGQRSGFPPNLEQRIRANWWAHAGQFLDEASRRGLPSISPPAYGRPLSSLPMNFALLFHGAFNVGHLHPKQRPSPRRFLVALDGLLRQLRRCTEVPTHFYYRAVTGCPYCEMLRRRRCARRD